MSAPFATTTSTTTGLNGYFKSYVDPHRGTVLVQGGHLSGKTTLLNALLGYHALPYFKSAPTPGTTRAGGGEDDGSLSSDGLPVHGQTTSRYTAGLGSTAVCILNAATVDPKGTSLQIMQPESGSIQHLVVPSSLTFAGFTRHGDLPVPPEISKTTRIILTKSATVANCRTDSRGDLQKENSVGMEPQDSASINDPSAVTQQQQPETASSAFCFVEQVYPNDFDVVGEVSTTTATGQHQQDPWQARAQQAFYYDAVSVMESSWKEWALRLQLAEREKKENKKKSDNNAHPDGDSSDDATGLAAAAAADERMLFVVGVNQKIDGQRGGSDEQQDCSGGVRMIAAKDFTKIHPDHIQCGPEAMPPLHCVESTDLSDRPPMTYVHSSLVVLTDLHDAPKSGNDQDGARRMYVQSTLFTRANNEPCLVYNLVKSSLTKMTETEVTELRQTLGRIWNVSPVNIYILSLRNALADAMLAKESIPAMNVKDTLELERLRRMVASQHVLAHSRFTERVLVARQKMLLRTQRAKEEATTQPEENQQQQPPAPTILVAPTIAIPHAVTGVVDHQQQQYEASYVPKVLTPQYRAEDAEVIKAAIDATTGSSTSASSDPTEPRRTFATSSPSAQDVIARNKVLNKESEKVSQEVLKRQSEYEPKCTQFSSSPTTISTSSRDYEPKCVKSAGHPATAVYSTMSRGSEGYVPKIIACNSTSSNKNNSEAYIPVSLRQQQQATSAKDEYVPKCVQNSSSSKYGESSARHQIRSESSTPTTTAPPTETRTIVVAPTSAAPKDLVIKAVLTCSTSTSTAPTSASAPVVAEVSQVQKHARHQQRQPIPKTLHAKYSAEQWMNMSPEVYDSIIAKYSEEETEGVALVENNNKESSDDTESVSSAPSSTATAVTTSTGATSPSADMCGSSSSGSSFDYLDEAAV